MASQLAAATPRERPILFSAPMVRAILEGRKTQTRRLIKPQPDVGPEYEKTLPQAWEAGFIDVPCPYGAPGDRLWVKETWRTWYRFDGLSPKEVAGMAVRAGYSSPWAPLRYDADGSQVNEEVMRRDDGVHLGDWGKTRVSIHMPRWASRITLEVTRVRVERLQDISEEDAMAEGITGPHDVGYPAFRVPGDSKPRYALASNAFAQLWCDINSASSWYADPWVWVVEFRRLP